MEAQIEELKAGLRDLTTALILEFGREIVRHLQEVANAAGRPTVMTIKVTPHGDSVDASMTIQKVEASEVA